MAVSTDRATRRLPAEQRREVILDAAEKVFGGMGYHEATTREIASAAGVSEALLYQHFPGKRQLFEAVIKRAAASLEQRIVAARIAAEPLRAGLVAFFDFVDEERDLYQVFFRQALQADPAFQRLYAELQSHFIELTAEAMDVEIGRSQNTELVSHALTGMVNELALFWVDRRSPSKDVIIEHATRMGMAILEAEVGHGG